ncbi:hypothetical protein D3C81_801410 [compost metagenome]
MLTLAMPQSLPAAETNRSASRRDSVKRHDDSPCDAALFSAMASSSEVYGIR